ncbi:hypothetical protein HPB51_002934 [Rhipicephalus microplus]|uniref:Uncharacterized protein n=1 Tax=Rhipicephalus microplus TaxID=6941 RepID=A0A9J6DSU0_RHIMP|nr:hypothetical protein HPB51_002934 [Rhipicephalus microplus]
MASPESCVLPADVPLPEDMDLQTSDDLTASGTSPTSTNNSAADTMPSRVLLLPDTNPFAPLRELEEQNSIEGKSENTFHQARIISTAPNGEKRARGSLIPTPERQHTSIPRDHSHMRSARHTLLASASYQNEEDGWIPVSYRRKQQNHAAVAVTPSSGAPRAYQHTVILRPKQPCRIMDEQFIRLDRVITRRISAHLNIPEEDPLPEFRVRYLGYSNQLAVDAAEPELDAFFKFFITRTANEWIEPAALSDATAYEEAPLTDSSCFPLRCFCALGKDLASAVRLSGGVIRGGAENGCRIPSGETHAEHVKSTSLNSFP